MRLTLIKPLPWLAAATWRYQVRRSFQCQQTLILLQVLPSIQSFLMMLHFGVPTTHPNMFFNISAASTIGKMSFISCKAEIFRGVVRLQSQPVIINNFIVDNCIIDSLAGYGVLTVDVNTSRVDNITIKNSTIYKAEKIIVSKNNSTSVLRSKTVQSMKQHLVAVEAIMLTIILLLPIMLLTE
jgi:hypothetical protein